MMKYCCFGYTTPVRKNVRGYGYRYVSNCKDGSHVTSLKYAQDGDASEDPWLDDDPGDEGVDPDSLVDVLYEDPPLQGEDRMFCELCWEYNNCEDNELPGANLTLFDECTARHCCSPPEGWEGFTGRIEVQDFTGGDLDTSEDHVNPEEAEGGPPGHFRNFQGYVSFIETRGSIFLDVEDDGDDTGGIDCAACEMYGMCTSPSGYEMCSSKGCCDDYEDPNADEWLPPPLPDDNSTDTATGTVITDQPDDPPSY